MSGTASASVAALNYNGLYVYELQRRKTARMKKARADKKSTQKTGA